MKRLLIMCVLVLPYISTKAQCPSLKNYKTGIFKQGDCPGVGANAIATNFTGTQYETVPTSGKVGNFTSEYSTSALPPVVPAIAEIWQGTSRMTDTAGPASPISTTGSKADIDYCFYGTTNIPTSTFFTIVLVDPVTDTVMESCTYSQSGSGASTTGAPTITSQPQDQAACIGYSATFSVTATASSGSISGYQWRKDGVNISGATSATYTISTVSASDTGTDLYSVVITQSTGVVTISKKASLTARAGSIFTGASSTAWNTAANWENGVVPDSTRHAYISGTASNMPTVSSGTIACKCLTIESGATFTVNGATIEIAGDIMNNGTFDVDSGTVVINGTTGAQTIPSGAFAADSVQNLTIANTNGVTLADTVNVTDNYTPTSGVLTTGGNLILKSGSAGSAKIVQGSSSGGYISGDVVVERYIPGGTRAYRFLNHPFSTSMTLGTLMDDIDITGKGGVDSGFTATNSNSSSAFWFDVTAADTAVSGTNSGWVAFTNTTGADWHQYETMRIFIRGAKGEGLLGQNYTPSATTLDMTGTVNQGDQTITLTKGTSSPYVLSGNPFPSPVQMNTVTKGSNISANFTVWDANQGVRGGYTSIPFSTSYIMPAFGSFVVTVAANSNNTMVFEEADKSTSTPQSVFKGTKTTGSNYWVQLRLTDSTTFWDRLMVGFDNNGLAALDPLDAIKLYNPSLDFFAWSANSERLSIDVRPYVEKDTIYLGLTAYDWHKNFEFEVPDVNMPTGTKLYLRDNYLNAKKLITPGFKYKFSVNADTNSQGNNRFSLITEGKPTNIITEKLKSDNGITLVPNPARNYVNVSFEPVDDIVEIKLVNMSGQIVYRNTLNAKTGQVTVPLHNIIPGIYVVNLKNSNTELSTTLTVQ